eukprot:TRINITY_DN2418_c0_g1_i4.p1 TRINITY_DN2418_c0_g1~~TRINITY_DN2418_c0_g1_i4.p1  ORF type:complete len:264 (+),score=46.09 TRINITY_DN2418_c0_g1_i4:344-1135(+)
MMSLIFLLVLAPVAIARELSQISLIVGNATNQGLVEASTNSSGTGDFTLGFTNEAFDSIFNGNLTTGVGRVRSFRVTVSNTTGPGEQESSGASNTSSFITTGGQFSSDAAQQVQSSSNNIEFPEAGSPLNASTATFTSGQTLGFSREFNSSGALGSYAGNQFQTNSIRLGAAYSESDGEGIAFSRGVNVPENIISASRSQGQSTQTVSGNNVLSYAEGELFSATGSEETGSGCAVRGGLRGDTVDAQTSQAACISAGQFYDRN